MQKWKEDIQERSVRLDYYYGKARGRNIKKNRSVRSRKKVVKLLKKWREKCK